MNIIPNNNPEKKVRNPRLSFQPCTSNQMVQPPYFQNYYPFANYLNAPVNDCFVAPKQKKVQNSYQHSKSSPESLSDSLQFVSLQKIQTASKTFSQN